MVREQCDVGSRGLALTLGRVADDAVEVRTRTIREGHARHERQHPAAEGSVDDGLASHL